MVIPDWMRGKNAGLNAGGDAIRNADWKAVWNAAREAGWNVSKDVRVDSAGDAGEEARLDVDWEAGGNFSLSIQLSVSPTRSGILPGIDSRFSWECRRN